MSRLSLGFLATAALIAVGLTAIQAQLVQVASDPSKVTGTTMASVASAGDPHAGH